MFDKEAPNKQMNKERLRLILTLDRISLSPRLMEMLKNDIIQVLSHYLVIDEAIVQVDLMNIDDQLALVIGIPIIMARHSSISTFLNN